jgi:hypothetical protein
LTTVPVGIEVRLANPVPVVRAELSVVLGYTKQFRME